MKVTLGREYEESRRRMEGHKKSRDYVKNGDREIIL
jgi:hypothetical protein